ncbi:MAG: flagellar hook-length control protein FliK [Zoogloeaceae bacterium]|jgi:hypothetical protein|nr:flagellar hook-length control protein FliK [Zoogloeaceae bacterium]
MIPAEIAAARAQLISDLVGKPLPAAAAQKAADVLKDLSPGQRMMATIQSVLSNGMYRANIAGRDMTLALPFAARAGDMLELEVVEQDGRMTLAVVAGKGGEAAMEGKGMENASVATRLTVAGKLIAELLGGLDKEGGKRPQPAPLNNAQPVVERFPEKAADLVSALKAALVKSGMFYEAHQAQWVQGKAPLESLLAEPQGRLSPAAHALQTANAPGSPPAPSPAANTAPATTTTATAAATTTAAAASANATAAKVAVNMTATPANATTAATTAAAASSGNAASQAADDTAGKSALENNVVRVGMGRAVAPDLTHLVQQQLEALATNTYVWQGQIWPGQNMDWEIVEEEERREKGENLAANWTTRLRLELPRLGSLEAVLKLLGGREIEISLRTENDAARVRLSADNAALRRRFETAGLSLKFLDIARHARRQE